MPREIDVFGIYVPALVPLFLLTVLVYWPLESALARRGFFQHVWHPSLFRFSAFVCLYAAASLLVYR